MKISVIIVNYNTREDLRACLTALAAQTIPHEVIVVDNASTDGSADMVREQFPVARLIASQVNTWFCGGNNLGLDHAVGEYALLLNPDTVPPPDALETLVKFMDANPEYAGATMQLRYPDGVIQRTCSRIPTYRYLLLTQTPLGLILRGAKQQAEAYHWYIDESWERDRDFDVQAVPGSCTLMRRADLRLDSDLKLYFNEDDLARRFAGRKFRFLASPHIIHREKSATRTARASQIYFADLMTYTRKHHGWPRMALLWALSRPLAWAIQLRWKLRR